MGFSENVGNWLIFQHEYTQYWLFLFYIKERAAVESMTETICILLSLWTTIESELEHSLRNNALF